MDVPEEIQIEQEFLEQIQLQYRLLLAFANVVDAVLASDPYMIPDDVMAKARGAKAIVDEHVI